MPVDVPRPMATYRLQFNHDFGFVEAQSLVPYFSRLGVTHLYASPILRARQDSTHGYDVVDPATINPNLGDKTELINLDSTLQNYGLGLILDIVPNHMAASIENPYWRDVLTYGPSSPFASWFDINWRMPDPEMWGRVLVPVLGEPRSRVLEKDQIRLDWSDGRFLVRYFDHTFPVDPATIPEICRFGWDELREKWGEDHAVYQRIREILELLEKLPPLAGRLRRRIDVHRDETENLLGEFAHLVVQSPTTQQWVEETAARFGQGEGGPKRLRKLLDAQPYRLVYWRAAARAINYRRFFDINELISIRQEDPNVFDQTHGTILRWIQEGLLDGLRIDHIDGLRDPLGYLERLTEAVSKVQKSDRSLPIFVEKILAPGEKLPCGWPVAGTTGYEFLNQLEAVFISREGFAEIERDYRRLLRRPVRFEQVARRGKRRILRDDLSPQVGRLADTLWRLAQRVQVDARAVPEKSNLRASPPRAEATGPMPQSDATPETFARIGQYELTKRDLIEAIIEVIVALPVYRTYVDSKHRIVSQADRKYIEEAVQAALKSQRAPAEAIYFLQEVLRLEQRTDSSEHAIDENLTFIERFQQLTGPAAAKGIEDTALYAYVPLASLNEVGGEPHLPPEDAIEAFHQANQDRAARWPATMLSVTTHDTKRTADVRARLDVLSELPKLWSGHVRRWRRTNKGFASRVRGKRAPDTATEYLFYQTIVGVWPVPDPAHPHELPPEGDLCDLRERIEGYMLKAAREAKTRTSWTNQDSEYEDALSRFIRGAFGLNDNGASAFLSDVGLLVARIARAGFWNSLSRTLVQFTAPGTPDIYQGDELWNLALVDPDNRRPVDYEKRKRLLDEIAAAMESPSRERRAYCQGLIDSPEDGRIKLHTIRSALLARRKFPQLFSTGHYVPLPVEGDARGHVLAFARVDPNGSQEDSPAQAAIVVVPRLTTSLTSDPSSPPLGEEVWGNTAIPLPGRFRHRKWMCALTGDSLTANETTLDVKAVLNVLPIGLLISESETHL